MKQSKSTYEKIDAVSKIAGLILLAVGIENISRGDYFPALALFGLGGAISIIPLLMEVET